MRCTYSLVILVLGTVAIRSGLAADQKHDQGADELLGTWIVEEDEVLGQKSPPESAGRMRLVFSRDKVVWQFDTTEGEKAYDGTYKADPKKKPKAIDLSQPQNPKVIALGIYKIEGDKLTIVMGPKRPKSFEEKTLWRLVLKKKPR